MEKPCCPPECCDMRGMLSFMILWLVSRRELCGEDIAREIASKKGEKPNPGTIYPALKEMEKRGLVRSCRRGRKVFYTMTRKGTKGLKEAFFYFKQAYGDIIDDYERILSL